MATYSETWRSLRHRNFRLFFAGQFVSQIGNWLTLVAQGLFALDRRGRGIDVGIVSACQFLPVLLFAAYGGLIADRFPKRTILLIVQALAMVQSFALAFVVSRPEPSFIWLCVVAGFGGLTLAIDNPTRRAFFVELVEEHDMPNAVGLNSSMMTSSRIAGPALAGLLIGTVGYTWCFLADGVSYAAVLVALAMMRVGEIRASPTVDRTRRQVRAGFQYVRSVPELWISLLLMTVVGTLAFNFQVVLPLLVTRTFHARRGLYTVLFSVLSLGSFVGALVAARRPSVELRDVSRSSIGFGLALCVLALTPWLWLAFPVAVVVGWSSVFFLTSSTSLVQMRADPDMRGRVLAMQAVVFLGTTPIGAPIVGAICDGAGPRVGTLVGGGAAVIAGAIALQSRSRTHEHDRPNSVAPSTEP